MRSILHSVIAISVSLLVALPAAGQPIYEVFKLESSDAGLRDEIGNSVGLSGSTVVVGRWMDDEAGHRSGSAYIFDTASGQQLFKLRPADHATQDYFGTSVAVSETTAIVGAIGSDHTGIASGSAFLFDTTTGQQLRTLGPSDPALNDQFGSSVAISGNVALVGAVNKSDEAVIHRGAAYLFDVTTGQQLFKLTAPDPSPGHKFGDSVAISGNTAIVGAWGDDEEDVDTGAVYLFDTSTGLLRHKLVAPDAESSDYFGEAVAVSGSVAIVGSKYDDDDRTNAGAAYLFDTETGELLFKLTAPTPHSFGRFGSAVAISGDIAIVGADGNTTQDANWGSAYLFSTKTGELLFEFTPSDGDREDRFGNAVGISGDISIVGAYFRDPVDGTEDGSVYVFTTCFPDLAPPIGTPNFFDLGEFLTRFVRHDPSVDLVEPFGSWSTRDLLEYLERYLQGCPYE